MMGTEQLIWGPDWLVGCFPSDEHSLLVGGFTAWWGLKQGVWSSDREDPFYRRTQLQSNIHSKRFISTDIWEWVNTYDTTNDDECVEFFWVGTVFFWTEAGPGPLGEHRTVFLKSLKAGCWMGEDHVSPLRKPAQDDWWSSSFHQGFVW